MVGKRDEESHAFLIGVARREEIKTITRDILCRADIFEGFHVRIGGTKSERLTDFQPAVASTIRLVKVLHIPSEHKLHEIGETLCSMGQHLGRMPLWAALQFSSCLRLR